MKIILTTLLTLSAILVNAQQILSIDEAIAVAMEKNFDIQIANKNLIQAEKNKNVQNTGFLPTLRGSGSASQSHSNVHIETYDEQVIETSGVKTTIYGGSVALNYTLYNGGNRINQMKKLKAAYELSDVQRKIQINNTLIAVYMAYYNVARANNQKNSLNESFDISKQRLIRTKYMLKFGQKTTLDVLNAQVDVNRDSLNLIKAQIDIDNAKRELNFLLGYPPDHKFEVNNTVEVNKFLDYNAIKQNVSNNNYQLLQDSISKRMSEYDLKISQSAWQPTLSANLSYGLNNGNYGPDYIFAVLNTHGFTPAVSLSWNIFDGRNNVKVQNARIEIQKQEIYREQTLLNIKKELDKYWADYKNQLAIVAVEELNLKVNQENFLKTVEQFKLGQVSSIDFRQAQLNLIQTKLNLTNAQFSAKLAELQLKKLEASLIDLN